MGLKVADGPNSEKNGLGWIKKLAEKITLPETNTDRTQQKWGGWARVEPVEPDDISTVWGIFQTPRIHGLSYRKRSPKMCGRLFVNSGPRKHSP